MIDRNRENTNCTHDDLLIYCDRVITLKSTIEFFERDLLISLMKFKLEAIIDSLNFLHNLLPTLSSQCSYSFSVSWAVESTVALPDASKILSDTCEQLKGLMSIGFELSVIYLDNIDKRMIIGYEWKSFFSITYILYYFRQNQWSDNIHASNIQLYQCNEIEMNKRDDEINEKLLSFSPSIDLWHKITSVRIHQPFGSILLHRLIWK